MVVGGELTGLPMPISNPSIAFHGLLRGLRYRAGDLGRSQAEAEERARSWIRDFGRSREGTGAYNFKRHWGFEPRPLPYQYALLDGASMPNMSPSNPKMRLAVEAWRRLPLAVTKRAGPFLTKFLP